MTHVSTIRWQPNRAAASPGAEVPLGTALSRGLAMRCPNCGNAPLFDGYLTVKTACPSCEAPLGLVRADDVPPYFTIVVVGHLVVPSMLLVEQAWHPDLWVHAALWVPLTLGLSLALLRPIKGATVGLMLRLGFMKDGGEA